RPAFGRRLRYGGPLGHSPATNRPAPAPSPLGTAKWLSVEVPPASPAPVLAPAPAAVALTLRLRPRQALDLVLGQRFRQQIQRLPVKVAPLLHQLPRPVVAAPAAGPIPPAGELHPDEGPRI